MCILLALFCIWLYIAQWEAQYKDCDWILSYSKKNPHGCRTVVFFINSLKHPIYNISMGNGCPLTWLHCAVVPTMNICSIHKITFQKTNIGQYIYIYTYFSMGTHLQDSNPYTYTLADVRTQTHIKILSFLTRAVLLLSASSRFFFSLSSMRRAWFSFASKTVMFWFAFSSSRWSLCVSRTAANHFFRQSSWFRANRINSPKRKNHLWLIQG